MRPPIPDATDRLPPPPPQLGTVWASANAGSRALGAPVRASPDTRAIALRITTPSATIERVVPPEGWSFVQGPGCPGATFDIGDRVCVSIAALDQAGNRSTWEPSSCVFVTRERDDERRGESSNPSSNTRIVGPLVLVWLGAGVLVAILLRVRRNRIAARPELRDTNLPRARLRRPDD